MRQEKTMKILANHLLDPRYKIEPSAGTDKGLCWDAFDFSDLKELKPTCFAIKFKTPEITQEFKAAFRKGQSDNAALDAGEDAKEGGAEADSLAAAIASVSVGGESGSPAKAAAAEPAAPA